MRSRLAVGLWLVLLAVCAWLVARTSVSGDLSAFLPRSPSPAQQMLVDQLREGVVSRLLLIAIEGAPAERLAVLSEALRVRLARDPGLAYVSNGAQSLTEADGRFLLEHRYALSPHVTAERFSSEGLRAALERDLDLLASPASMLLTQLLPSDPTGEFLGLLETMQGESGPEKREGVWFSRDGHRALLIAQTRTQGFDLDGQQAVIERVRAAFSEVVGNGSGARLLLSGPGVFAVAARAAIQQDAMRLSSIALVLVAGLLLAVYRSPRVVGLTLLPVVSGAVVGAAAVSLGFGTIYGVTLGFGVTLIGEAVDYAIYLFTHLTPADSAEHALRRLWPTLSVGVLTSVFGFGPMVFSGFPGLAQLGVLSIAGLVAAALTTRFVLPGLVPRRFEVRSADALAGPLLVLIRHARLLRIPLLVALLVGVIWLARQGAALWDDDLASLSPVPEVDKELDSSLRAELGAPDLRQLVVVPADSADAALERAERVGTRLQALQDAGAIAGFDSPARYLPSVSAQRTRLAALPEGQTLRRNLETAARGLPFRAEAFADFVSQAQTARAQPPLTRADLQGTGLALKVDSLLVERHGEWFAILPLRGVSDPAPIAAEIGQLQDTGALLLDLKRELDALYHGYRSRTLTFSLIGAGAIVVLLLASLRSVRRTFDVLAPLAAAVVAVCAILSVASVQLTLFNLVALLLVVGVGSNYSLFFERDNLNSGDPRRTLAAVLLCNLSTVTAFGLLALSRSPVLAAIGATVALGAFLSLLFAAVFTARVQAASIG